MGNRIQLLLMNGCAYRTDSQNPVGYSSNQIYASSLVSLGSDPVEISTVLIGRVTVVETPWKIDVLRLLETSYDCYIRSLPMDDVTCHTA